MQLQPFATSAFKAGTRDHIKAFRMRLQRTSQNVSLFWRRVQLYHKRSIHAQCISYIRAFVKRQEVWVAYPLLRVEINKKPGRASEPFVAKTTWSSGHAAVAPADRWPLPLPGDY